MKPAKLLTTIVLLFIATTIFAQKVHYKDSYYTIVKSKIFHRGYDVYGRLSPGKIDTIHIIAKELYTENGKLKDKYKKRKKRDRYKIPEGFWQQRNTAATAVTHTNINEVPKTTVVQNEAENNPNDSTASAARTVSTSVKETKQERPTKVSEEKKETKEVTNKETEKGTNDGNSLKKTSTVEEKVEKGEKRQKKSTQKDEAKLKTSRAQQKKEQEKPRESTPDKASKNSKSKQVKDQKNKVEKSNTRETNQAKKSTKKRAQETKKLENKKRDLDKEKNTQSKKQKSINAAAAVIASGSLANAALSKKETFGTIYIKVNTEKTSTTKSGDILLFFDVINNSNKDLIILKPNNSMDFRIDFFSNTMECEDIPIKSTDYVAKDLKIKDEDFLTIPANTKIELFVNGTYRNWLACNSEDIVLQIQYNPFKNTEEGIELQPPYKKELNKSLKRITPIKIESENIKFKLNKQE